MNPSWGGQFSAALAPFRLLASAFATAVFIVFDVAGLPIKGMDSASWLWAALASFLVFVWLVYRRLLLFPARLRIVYSPEHPMWWPQQGWYRIKVENESRWTQAPNVRARVESIVPNPLPFNAVPSDLGVKDGESHDVNPGAYILFDVVQHVPGTPRDLRLYVVGSMGQTFQISPGTDYEMLIRVTAANTASREKVFVMRQGSGASLEFGPKGE